MGTLTKHLLIILVIFLILIILLLFLPHNPAGTPQDANLLNKEPPLSNFNLLNVGKYII
jgi:hypothetical protein